MSSSASIYLHSSVDINSAILIYTAVSASLLFLFFVRGAWCIFKFMEDKKGLPSQNKIYTVSADGIF